MSINYSIESDDSVLSIARSRSDTNESSNIKTSTFDESHLDKYFSPKPAQTHVTQPHFKLTASPKIKTANKRDELENLVNTLIDKKLEKKEQSRVRQLSNQQQQHQQKNSPLSSNSPGARSPIVPLNPKLNTATTQTKITNKRFYSPEKLAPFQTQSNKQAVISSSPLTTKQRYPPPPLLLHHHHLHRTQRRL